MSLEKVAKFSEIVGKLKTVKRSGWASHVGIENPESVADHSFRCAVLAMCIGDLTSVDTEKLIKMLLLHDVQEALIGDYDTSAKKKIGLKKFKAKEKSAARTILSLLPSRLQERYIDVWQEFEDQETPEAILANDIEKIEMIFQALEYEGEGHDSEKFDVFWASVQTKIKTSVVHDLLELLKDRGKSV